MKKLLLLAFCLLLLKASAQQKMNTFYLVDDATQKAIPSVSVSIVRAQLSITTESDGIFRIPGDLSKMRDTIIFFAQHYEPLRLRLQDLSAFNHISLKKTEQASRNIKIKLKRDTLLNDFNRLEISYYTGLRPSVGTEFLQLAQKFEAPMEGVVLNRVYVHRLAFVLNHGDYIDLHQYKYTDLEHTKFRLRFYDTDPTTGGPGKDLCDRTVEISSTDQNQLDINLNNYNITIPHKSFYIAIEWMRDYFNASKVDDYSTKDYRYKTSIIYKPSIGISPNMGNKLNIWALNFAHKWKPYTEFSPFGTDLAIKVKVNY